MKHPEDNSSSDVTRLLRCKRYEQPPPGYFLSFSDKIIARIEAEETLEHSSWWNWLVARFDARPVLVCIYGLAVSSLLLAGFRMSQAFEAELAANATPAGFWFATGPSSPLLHEVFSTADFQGRITPASFSGSRLLFQDEEPNHLLLPVRSSRMHNVAFSFSGR